METEALRERFPWLDTDGDADMDKAAITLGCLGTAHEGWFDPWALLNGMRNKARELGVEYHQGTVTGMSMDASSATPAISGVEVSGFGPDQNLTLEAGEVVCAAGAWAASVVGMCGDATAVAPLPVAPRKRCIFTFHCPEEGAPDGLTTPLTVLPETGVYFRPEGAPGNFLCGVSPDADDDPDITLEDLDHVAHHLFDDVRSLDHVTSRELYLTPPPPPPPPPPPFTPPTATTAAAHRPPPPLTPPTSALAFAPHR